MRPSLRFLALAVVGWAAFRAETLGMLPGAQLFEFERNEPKVPAIVPTRFPAIERVQPAQPLTPEAQSAAVVSPSTQPPVQQLDIALPAPAIRYVRGVVGVPVAMRPGVVTVYQLPTATPSAAPARLMRAAAFTSVPPSFTPPEYALLPALSLSGIFSLSAPASHPSGAVPDESVPVLEQRRIDRVQLTTWALLRSQ